MNEHPNHSWLRKSSWKLAFAVPVIFLMLSGLPLLGAFEAHVVNVTAKIEPEPPQCIPRSHHYWKDHEGCKKKGKGSSVHASAVQTLSNSYGGAFDGITGNNICKILNGGHCPGDSTDQARCDAKQHTLVLYLNLATMRLNPDALIAGADDGKKAFDHLGINAYASIAEALLTLEGILSNENAKKKALQDAAHIAKRITEFYEKENYFSPKCIFDRKDVQKCIDYSFNIRIRNENRAVIDNDIDIDINTGGNSVSGGDAGGGGDGGEGGTIVTGDATVNVSVQSNVNTNQTTIDTSCDDCEEPNEVASRERETREDRESRTDSTATLPTDIP